MDPFDNLGTPEYSRMIALSRYARWLPEKNRRETWEETVERYFAFMQEHLEEKHGYKMPKALRKELQDAVYNLEVMPSMRALMTAGPALKRCNVAGFNCSFLPIDHPRAFDELLYILMCFAPDTEVKTRNGDKPISEITTDDEVLSFNPDKKKYEYVCPSFVGETASSSRKKMKLTFADGSVVECTADHKFLTTNRGWVEAQDLTDEDDIQNIFDEMIGFVYQWTNKENGKKYIGVHKGAETDGYVGSGVGFKRALEKYGLDCFERTILYREFEDLSRLYQTEFDLINEHNAVEDPTFYNQTNYDPKYYVEGKRTRRLSEETKEKIRLARTGTKASEEVRQKLSRQRKGKPSPTKGYKGLTSGEKNGQFGKRWYNDGINEYMYQGGNAPDGWKRGRLKGNFLGENNPFYGKTHSKETKEKLAKANKRFSGENNPFYGKTHSEETRSKMKKYWADRRAV